MASYALELFQLLNGCIEFTDNGGTSTLKSRHATPIEPVLVVPTGVEPSPYVRAKRPVVPDDGTHVINVCRQQPRASRRAMPSAGV